MKKGTALKIMAILFIPVAAISVFSWGSIWAGLQILSINSIFIVLILLVLGAPFLYVILQWLLTSLNIRLGHGLTSMARTKNVRKPVEREEAAIQCLERHLGLSTYMKYRYNRKPTIVSSIPTAVRDDATQWDLYLITTDQIEPDMNTEISYETTSPIKTFYVFVNAHTCESYHIPYAKTIKQAIERFDSTWNKGVKKIEPSQFDKFVMEGFARGMGESAAKKDEKDKEEKDVS